MARVSVQTAAQGGKPVLTEGGITLYAYVTSAPNCCEEMRTCQFLNQRIIIVESVSKWTIRVDVRMFLKTVIILFE